MAEKNMNENKKDGMDEATAEPKVLDKPESFDLYLDSKNAENPHKLRDLEIQKRRLATFWQHLKQLHRIT